MRDKILLITGSQNRHLSIANQIIKKYDVDWIIYQRKLVPQDNASNFTNEEKLFLDNHLEKLKKDEIKEIGEFNLNILSDNVLRSNGRILKLKGRSVFNSTETVNWVKENSYDLSIDYGSGIIEKSLLEAINCLVVNIHGGISPYFKGSSTLLYALMMSQPELVGMTVHKIDEGIDSGDIYRHILPKLEENMSPTEIFAACQKKLIEEINPIINNIINKKYISQKQSSYGKTFMERDFRIENLENLYESYKNGNLAKTIKKIDENILKYKIIR